MQAVMYHYVRPGPEDPPYEYYYLDIDDFRAQLDYFTREYELLDRETFLDCVAGECSPPDEAVILTFDDGLVDHHDHVLPELESRDLWGLFFVSGPIGVDALSVHRVHTLLGTTSAAAVDRVLRELVDTDDVRAGLEDEFEEIYADSDSAVAVNRIKRTLNFLLPYERVPVVLDELEARFPTAQVNPEDLYMTAQEIERLAEAGMLVGGHTVSHRVLSRLPASEQRDEVKRSLANVDEIVKDQPIRSFAYPYGAAETFDENTLIALRSADCDVAFTTEPGTVTAGSLRESPLRLARRDCNEFPHGGASRY